MKSERRTVDENTTKFFSFRAFSLRQMKALPLTFMLGGISPVLDPGEAVEMPAWMVGFDERKLSLAQQGRRL